jgi:hypothetical protein
LLFWKAPSGFLDGGIYLFQESAHIFRPSLAILFPGALEFTQVARITKTVLAIEAEVRFPMGQSRRCAVVGFDLLVIGSNQ